MTYHVVFLKSKHLRAIRAERKKVELRLSTRRAPFMLARPGDRALLKESCGDVQLECVFGEVDQFDCPSQLPAFLERWCDETSRDYLLSKPRARFGIAAELLQIRERHVPADRLPKGVRVGWVSNFDLSGVQMFDAALRASVRVVHAGEIVGGSAPKTRDSIARTHNRFSGVLQSLAQHQERLPMNRNCCGGHCRSEHGEVRVYPLGGGATLILCEACWAHENAYRASRVRQGGVRPEAFPQVDWGAAEVYNNE